MKPEKALLHTASAVFHILRQCRKMLHRSIDPAPAIGGYQTARFMAVPDGRDGYEVVFDKNDTVVSQKISSWFGGP